MRQSMIVAMATINFIRLWYHIIVQAFATKEIVSTNICTELWHLIMIEIAAFY